ncbi:MAG: stage II sporulation protein M [Desulfobacterales bacterium]|nr:stage II sporulation protein M [Desulfobacterales bacterium]
MMKKLFFDAGRTIFEARGCIILVFIVYCCAAAAGWSHPEKFPFFEGVTKQLMERFVDISALAFISKLFIHNLIATYFTMCLVVLFGLAPMASAVFNGLAVGWVVSNAAGAANVDIFLMLAPHGVLEWPAVMIGWGVGVWRGVGHRFSDSGSTHLERMKRAHVVFVTFVIPLLFFAAIIEGRYHIARELFPAAP